MRTLRLTVDPSDPDPAAIERAAAVIRHGGLVAFPTETVYGLGADAFDAAAVAGIFVAKGRALDDPCIVHLSDPAELPRVSTVDPARVAPLAARFWPGPLSVVVPKTDAVPGITTAGRPTVAVRVPAHAVALALIRASGVPIAAPSANLFMHTSPTTADHVLADLDGRVDLVLDGGPTAVGVESTVLDLTAEPPRVLRPGGVTLEALREALGEVVGPGERVAEGVEPAASPGLMPKHYAPRAEMVLIVGDPARARPGQARPARAERDAGRQVGLLLFDSDAPHVAVPGAAVESLGSEDRLDVAAARLYSAIRALDNRGVDVILARSAAEQGIGRAIHDRLLRSAGSRPIRV